MRFPAYASKSINMLQTTLSALADPTRLAALRLIWDGEEHCVCELVPKLGATQSRMSRHMAALKAAGLVIDRRDRQWVRYRINPALSPDIRALVAAAMVAYDAQSTKPESLAS